MTFAVAVLFAPAAPGQADTHDPGALFANGGSAADAVLVATGSGNNNGNGNIGSNNGNGNAGNNNGNGNIGSGNGNGYTTDGNGNGREWSEERRHDWTCGGRFTRCRPGGLDGRSNLDDMWQGLHENLARPERGRVGHPWLRMQDR